MTKTARIEARIEPEYAERITRAAALTGESVSRFMVRAALTEADYLIARSDITIMPADLFDELIATIDEPDEAPVLARVTQQPRRYAQR
jgi:uncharacterized protein (DUF1778 family)